MFHGPYGFPYGPLEFWEDILLFKVIFRNTTVHRQNHRAHGTVHRAVQSLTPRSLGKTLGPMGQAKDFRSQNLGKPLGPMG